jgi:maleate isomerase
VDALRIGMLTPSSNTVLEPATAALASMLEGRVSVHYARFPVTKISDEADSHGQFALGPMMTAAGLLADARVHVITWNGTSGAWEGLEVDRELVDRISARTGIPATTATLTLVDLMRQAGIKRYGLVVPYDDSITTKIEAVLGGEGFECVGKSNAGITENFAFAEVEATTVARWAGSVAAGAEAVVIHCTNLRGAEVAGVLAYELQIPVLDSVVVAFRGALDAVGIEAALPGLPLLAPRR